MKKEIGTGYKRRKKERKKDRQKERKKRGGK